MHAAIWRDSVTSKKTNLGEKMELNGNFLPQFKVRENQFTLLPPSKRGTLRVVGMFTREPFPAQFYRWKNLEVHSNDDRIFGPSEWDSWPKLNYTRLQLPEEEYTGLLKREFGNFVAREVALDEEYWMAAWLRAEAHSESLNLKRHALRFKMKYVEEEFYALKQRCLGQEGNSLNCICLVAVKRENRFIRRTVLSSIVGTLDLSIRPFMPGETYPGEIKKHSAVLTWGEPCGTHKYAYIANVVVALGARRRGIASNMLYLATDAATAAGVKQLFVHVNADNKPAQNLYFKTGFKVVEEASHPESEDADPRILMSKYL